MSLLVVWFSSFLGLRVELPRGRLRPRSLQGASFWFKSVSCSCSVWLATACRLRQCTYACTYALAGLPPSLFWSWALRLILLLASCARVSRPGAIDAIAESRCIRRRPVSFVSAELRPRACPCGEGGGVPADGVDPSSEIMDRATAAALIAFRLPTGCLGQWSSFLWTALFLGSGTAFVWQEFIPRGCSLVWVVFGYFALCCEWFDSSMSCSFSCILCASCLNHTGHVVVVLAWPHGPYCWL